MFHLQAQGINAEMAKATTTCRSTLASELISHCRQVLSWQLLTHMASTASAVETQASSKSPVQICPTKNDLVHGYGTKIHLPSCSPLHLDNWLVKKALLVLVAISHDGQHLVVSGFSMKTIVLVSFQELSLSWTLSSDLESVSLSHVNSPLQLATKEVTWQETNVSISPNLAKAITGAIFSKLHISMCLKKKHLSLLKTTLKAS